MNKNMTIGILAHVDAGKTTISEGILYIAGALRKMGRVDHRDTFLDNYDLERDRGITIFSKQAIFEYGGYHFTLLDTPGHADFSAEMERTLSVLDAAVLLISAPDGITGQTRTLWKLLKHYHVPTFIFVNKMDQYQGDKADLLKEIKSSLSSNCIDFSSDPASPEFQEELAVCDEELLNNFLDGKEISNDQVKELISKRKCFPCAFGSALKMEGIESFLSLVASFAPVKKYDENGDFSAKVFKISRDANGNRLTHIKITSGSLAPKTLLGDEKIDQIRFYSGEKYDTATKAVAGQICAVTGLSSALPGEMIGSTKDFSTGSIMQPILSCSVLLPDGKDPIAFYKELKALEEEDPTLQLSFNDKAQVIEIKVMGEVQKEVLKHMVKQRFGTEIDFGPGHIVYKETIANKVEGVGHFEPLRHYAEVHLLLEPAAPGSGISFATKCSTDKLSLNWQRLILTHLQEKKHLGVLTGSEITDIKITLIAGKAHEKHTEGGDFRQATYRAVRQGLMSAKSVLLEPVLDYRLEIPSDAVGRALTDMQRMNGTTSLPDIIGEKALITGTVPAACFLDYASELSSYTRGEGQIFTTFRGYEPCHNEEEVIESFGYDPELDVDNPSSSVFCSHGSSLIIPWDEAPEKMHVDSGLFPKERTAAVIEKEFVKYKNSEEELKAIFERTYGKIAPRYVETAVTYDSLNQADTPESDNRDYDLEAAKKEKHQNTASSIKNELNKEYLLVDGYNIIYASSDLSDLAKTDLKAARDKLIDILINFQGFRREQVIVVFDAYKVAGGKEHTEEMSGLLIVYTKEAETADQYIEKAAHEISKKYKVTVATSDAIEQVIVLSSGAYRLSARDFWDEIERTEEIISEKIGLFLLK